MKKIKKVIIIGSGPAGYTASIYIARANLKPILITGINEGGQLIKSNKIENWPGEKNGIKGINLMLKMKKQSIKFKTKIIKDEIIKIKKKKKYFKLIGIKYVFYTLSIIIATGTIPKKIKIIKKKKIYKNIISNCVLCDGFLYKKKIVTIIGGGNSAIEESLFLSKIAKKINIIHRKNKLKGEKILIKKIYKNIKKNKIKFYKNYKIIDICIKKNTLKKIYIKSTINKKIKKIKTQGLFISIGYKPNIKFFKKKIKLDKKGYIILNNKKYKSMTNIKGIFAAGDIISKQYKQAIIASASGCIAAIDIQKYLITLKKKYKNDKRKKYRITRNSNRNIT